MALDLTYDPEADAVYIQLSDVRPVEGEDAAPGVTLHYADDGKVVGVEVLPASKVLAPGAWSEARLPGPLPAVAAE